MISRLESIPRDILQHIAVLVGSSSPLHPPVDLLSLILANSFIQHSLSLNSAPHVYASVFSFMFDSPFILQHHRIWTTNSGLSHELMRRLRLLKRSHRRDVSPEGLLPDLWTAYWMLCESGPRNELQLTNVDFAGFLLLVARHCLPSQDSIHGAGCMALKRLIVWLLTLSLSRRTLSELTPKDRDELKDLIFPYMYLFKRSESTAATHCQWSKDISPPTSCVFCRVIDMQQDVVTSPSSLDSGSSPDSDHVCLYGQRHTTVLADSSFAAIGLSSAIKEMYPLTVPKHLPSRRNSTGTQAFLGLTREDVLKMGAYETPLFADSMPDVLFDELQVPLGNHLPRGLQGGTLLGHTLGAYARTEGTIYTLGTMSGLWEGVHFGISEAPNGTMRQAEWRKYLQCHLVEFYPVDRRENTTNKCASNDIHYIKTQNCSELCVRDRRYQKFSPSVEPDTSSCGAPGRATGLSTNKNANALDPTAKVILMGETLTEHDHAWGGYVFSGTVDPNGLITLRRESKEGGDVHHFEGRLLFGNVFVGRCGISTSAVGEFPDIHQQMSMGRFPFSGIFSMKKVSES